MTAYIALLRAVNLAGKNKVSMPALRDAVEAGGWSNVRTLLNSGNLVFEGKAQRSATIERALEAMAKKDLGLITDFFVRSAKEWSAIVAANPFPKQARQDPGHLLLMPLKGKPSAARVKALVAAIPGRELAKAHGRELYLFYPDGIGRSKLTNAFIEKHVGLSGTGRNWNTVLKLLAQSEG